MLRQRINDRVLHRVLYPSVALRVLNKRISFQIGKLQIAMLNIVYSSSIASAILQWFALTVQNHNLRLDETANNFLISTEWKSIKTVKLREIERNILKTIKCIKRVFLYCKKNTEEHRSQGHFIQMNCCLLITGTLNLSKVNFS